MIAAGDTEGGYRPQLTPRSRTLAVRGLAYHVREWGPEDGPVLVLLHGRRDTSASFQFVVDALRGTWRVVAPDWRGHGRSGWTPGSYWQAEFMADLDALLDAVSLGRAVPLVGHSMGGNIASIYAGAQPQRVERLVMLDAMGELLHRTPVKVDEVLRLVLDARGPAPAERVYAHLSDLADRLRQRNRRLSAARAGFLAAAMARTLPGGRFGWPFDPTFRRSLPTLHTVEEWGAVWRGIAAPVLCVMSSDHRPNAPMSDPDEMARRASYFRNLTRMTIPETGHNVHHDAPEAVAGAIEDFIGGGAEERGFSLSIGERGLT